MDYLPVDTMENITLHLDNLSLDIDNLFSSIYRLINLQEIFISVGKGSS